MIPTREKKLSDTEIHLARRPGIHFIRNISTTPQTISLQSYAYVYLYVQIKYCSKAACDMRPFETERHRIRVNRKNHDRKKTQYRKAKLFTRYAIIILYVVAHVNGFKKQ